MDLATLDVSPDEATEQLRHYERIVKEERTAEDEAIAAGYRAAARGLPVISLSQTMAAGGWFPNGLPHLAVCRADARECYATVNTWRRNGRHVVTFTDRQWDRGRARIGRYRVEVDMPMPVSVNNRATNGHTIVPLVPPQHRPRRPRLGRFHILWEVEQWDLTPPRDPALLRHIRCDLWAVMAVWDLTELERAVLSARADG